MPHEELPEPTERPCGCPLDYHLADCPIIAPPIEEPRGLDLYEDDDYYDRLDQE